MPRWPMSAERAREMYAGARGDADAKWFARFWGRVFAAGLMPRRWVTLEVAGRRTGQPMRVPLGMADLNGRWYLVSMLGPNSNWVLNAEAADGRVILHRRRASPVVLVEVPVEERAPILRRYLAKAAGARPHIPVTRDAPLGEFAAVAADYPVFAVHTGQDDGTTPWTPGPSRWPLPAGALLAATASGLVIRGRRRTAPGAHPPRASPDPPATPTRFGRGRRLLTPWSTGRRTRRACRRGSGRRGRA